MGGRFAAVLVLTTVVGLGAGAGTARYTTAPPAAPTPVVVARAAAPAKSAQGRGPSQGTIDKVEANKLTVRTETGSVDVALTEQATVIKQERLAAADLKVGDSVIGRGEAGSDGKLVVRQLQVTPAGARTALFGGDDAASKPGGGQAARPGNKPGGGDGGGGSGNKPGGSFGGQGGEGVIGTLAKVDGATITVTRPNGEAIATLAPGATIQRLAPAAKADLKPGQTVTVATPGDRTIVTITTD